MKDNLLNKGCIEILGAAGSGKSTVCQYLSNFSENIIVVKGAGTAKRRRLISFILFILIFLVFWIASIPKLRRNEFYLVCITAFGWNPNIVGQKKCVIFDQGVLFSWCSFMFYLLDYPGYIKKILYFLMIKFLKRILTYYDHVVYLFSSEDILIKRVMLRNKKHQLKRMNACEREKFINKFFSVFEILFSISLQENIPVVRFNSDIDSVDAIATSLLALLNSSEKFTP